jgi:hypothetical protein
MTPEDKAAFKELEPKAVNEDVKDDSTKPT